MIHVGDCVEVMATMPDASVDAICTDPPYGLEFMGSAWDKLATPKPGNLGGFADGNKPSFERVRAHLGAPMQEWHYAWAIEALRVLKPGGHLVAFGGTRTYHRLAAALEDAGFEIRDCLSWNYGSGFPKSLDVSKAIDAAAGAEREVIGLDEDRLRRRPEAWGGGQNGDNAYGDFAGGKDAARITAPATPEAARWEGWGTALKPAWEPVVLARKPLAGTVAANVQAHGTGALNIDATRIGVASRPLRSSEGRSDSGTLYGAGLDGSRAIGETTLGRWPANTLLSHETIPVLSLRDDIDPIAEATIRAFYGRYTRVQEARSACERRLLGVPEVVHGSPSMGESRASEVLLADVQGPLPASAPGAGVLPLWPSPHGGVEGEDERVPQGEAHGRGVVPVEGRDVPDRRLPDGHGEDSPDRGSGARPADDEAGLRAGASSGDGAGFGAPADAVRGCASSERREVGQPGVQPDGGRSGESFSGASSGGAGVDAGTGGGTSLEVLAGDVPDGWLPYFKVVDDLGCVQLDPARVNGNGHYPAVRGEIGYQGGWGGHDGLVERSARGAECWACVPGCPVRTLDEQSGETASHEGGSRGGGPGRLRQRAGSWQAVDMPRGGQADAGGASRFFAMFPGPSLSTPPTCAPIAPASGARFRYCPKSSRAERNAGLDGVATREVLRYGERGQGPLPQQTPAIPRVERNHHPTVKPVEVMRWLCKLVCPPGGTILDPFLGSGTTGIAAALEGFRFVGVERDAEYAEIARRRIAWWREHGDEAVQVVRRAERAEQARVEVAAAGQLNLFGGDTPEP